MGDHGPTPAERKAAALERIATALEAAHYPEALAHLRALVAEVGSAELDNKGRKALPMGAWLQARNYLGRLDGEPR
jgi:hypothetical protein